ncbi:MAG: hypothetical protein KY468_09710 [Armatimonadetes bacterium]|nr:hypothetical protein [Armatimonadota bacterium]
MLKLSVTLILEAHCPKCGRGDLPLGENPRYGVVAVCPGCGWEHQVQFLQKGTEINTGEVLSEISAQLQEALARMDLPQDVLLNPARERRTRFFDAEEPDESDAPASEADLPPDPPPDPPPGFFKDGPGRPPGASNED